MPLPSKPTDNSEFATSGVGPKVRPSFYTDGYLDNQIPEAEEHNWLFNNLFLWEQYQEDLTDFVLTYLVFNDTDNILKLTNTGAIYQTIEVSNYDGNVDMKSHDDASTPDYTNELNNTPQTSLSVTKTTSLANTKKSNELGYSGKVRSYGWPALLNEYYRVWNLIHVNHGANASNGFENYWNNIEHSSAGTPTWQNGGSPDPTLLASLNSLLETTYGSEYVLDTDEMGWYTNSEKFGYLNIGQRAISFACQHNYVDSNEDLSYVSDNELYQNDPRKSVDTGGGGSLLKKSALEFRDDGTIRTFTAGSVTHGNVVTMTAGPYLSNLGTSWTSSSDERIKTITGDIQNAVDKLSNLRTVQAYFNADNEQRVHPVLIAQDIAEQLPSTAIFPENYDEELTPDDAGFEAIGVNYQELIPVLVAAIKEQKTEIDNLKARVTALENG